MTPFKARHGIDSRGSLLNIQDEQLHSDPLHMSNEESLKKRMAIQVKTIVSIIGGKSA
jgi:hypothetical protein